MGLEAPQQTAEVPPSHACPSCALAHRELALMNEAQVHQSIAFLLAQSQHVLSPGAGSAYMVANGSRRRTFLLHQGWGFSNATLQTGAAQGCCARTRGVIIPGFGRP